MCNCKYTCWCVKPCVNNCKCNFIPYNGLTLEEYYHEYPENHDDLGLLTVNYNFWDPIFMNICFNCNNETEQTVEDTYQVCSDKGDEHNRCFLCKICYEKAHNKFIIENDRLNYEENYKTYNTFNIRAPCGGLIDFSQPRN